MILGFLDKHKDVGLLFLRVSIGLIFVWHGYPKIMGGPSQWHVMGRVLQDIGIQAFPAFWGFMAAFAEFIGGLFIILGIGTRLFAILLTLLMSLIMFLSLKQGAGALIASPFLKDIIIFLSLVIMGSGKYSVDELLIKAVAKEGSLKPKD